MVRRPGFRLLSGVMESEPKRALVNGGLSFAADAVKDRFRCLPF